MSLKLLLIVDFVSLLQSTDWTMQTRQLIPTNTMHMRHLIPTDSFHRHLKFSSAFVFCTADQTDQCFLHTGNFTLPLETQRPDPLRREEPILCNSSSFICRYRYLFNPLTHFQSLDLSIAFLFNDFQLIKYTENEMSSFGNL